MGPERIEDKLIQTLIYSSGGYLGIGTVACFLGSRGPNNKQHACRLLRLVIVKPASHSRLESPPFWPPVYDGCRNEIILRSARRVSGRYETSDVPKLQVEYEH
jgi:hypothetical protein